MMTCCSRLFGGVDIADSIITGLSHKLPNSAMRLADSGKVLELARNSVTEFLLNPKDRRHLPFIGRQIPKPGTGNGSRIGRCASADQPHHLAATFFALEFNRNATNRITPARLSSAARRHTLEPMLERFRSCSEGGFHSAGTTGSTNTIPAIFSG